MTSKIIYRGDLRTDITHIKSGTKVQTDAPVDNHGKGEAFSPTDFVASALGSCMMTIMGIKASEMQIDLTDTEIFVTKIMGENPRRIAEIKIDIHFSKNLSLSDKDKKILEKVAHACPVGKSLHPELVQNVNFNW